MTDPAARLGSGVGRVTASVGHRLVGAMLLASLAVALTVSALQMWGAYRDEREVAQQRLEEIGTSVVPSLAASLWMVDQERVALLLDGLARLRLVGSVSLTTPEGDYWQRGEPDDEPLLVREYPLRHRGAESVMLGTLRIEVSRAVVLQRLREQAYSIAITTTLSLLAAAVLIYLMMRHGVTRHLYAMAAYARTLNLQRLRTPLVLEGRRRRAPDELDQVVQSFNLMRETLLEDFALRERQEAELVQHRERLEELVAARTAELAAQADELREQREQVQRLVNSDMLTGAASRRHFAERAAAEIARSRRHREPLGLLLVDVDHFKQINDRYGHATGDEALVQLCDTLRGVLRPFDVLGRLGGEEFALLLPGCDADTARATAERLRGEVAARRLAGPQGEPISMTVSVGAAALDERDGGLEALLRRADEALYRAKRGGRNQVCMAVAAG